MSRLQPLRRAPAPAASSDPADLILACHGRIRAFLAMGERIAQATDAPPAEIASAAADVRRYFAVALPLHELDEEQSIAPRLLASTAKSEVQDAIGAMVAEHAAAHAVLDQIEPLWERLVVTPTELPTFRARLVEAQEALSQLMHAHLAGEERVVIPAIGRALAREERDAIAAEIRARRTT
jgi:iron-sulfur cluster repair protein YtfE (RIC family)